MKKVFLWIVAIFALLFIIGECSDPLDDEQQKDKNDSIKSQLVKDAANEKAKQDSINAIKVKELAQYFTEKKDEFSDTKWIEPKNKPRYTNQNGYCMYFCVEDSVAYNPRFLIQYESDDWLFIQNMIFNVDGENITFTPGNIKRDCGYGGRIWEWCDESALNLEYLIWRIAYANSVKIKMVGRQYSDVRVMTKTQMQYFKYSYEYYKAMGGEFKSD